MDDEWEETPTDGAAPSVSDSKPSSGAGKPESGSRLPTADAHVTPRPTPAEQAGPAPIGPSSRVFGALGQHDRVVLGVMSYVLSIFCGFASAKFQGFSEVGFIVCGWLLVVLCVSFSISVVNWPKWFGSAAKAIAFAVAISVLGLYTGLSVDKELVGVAPSPLPTTDFRGVVQTPPKDAAVLLAFDLWLAWQTTGATRISLSQALAAEDGSPIYPTDWPKALPVLEKQGVIKNVQPVSGSEWTYHGLNGRIETFNTDYWLTYVAHAGSSRMP